jgi:hypothetical protein
MQATRCCATLCAIVTLAACSSTGVAEGSPDLDGTWAYVSADGTQGLGATFRSDGTYELDPMVFPTSGTAQQRVETGTYSAAGSWITFTPHHSSCPGPDPVVTAPFRLNNGYLYLTAGSTEVALQRAATPAPATATVQIGCFDASGTFTAAPVAAVQN